MGKFNPYDQENMYRMDEDPPEMALNDYIVEYKQTGDGYWLACYLHQFEKTVFNRWVYKQCHRYSQLSRFKDFKQEMLMAMFEKLDDYDPAVGTTLIQFAARSMINAVHDYMRKNVGMYLLSDKYYQNLRTVNAIYYRDPELTHDERVQVVLSEKNISLKRVLQYIEDGKWFRYPENIESNMSDFELGKRTLDMFSSPEHILVHNAFEKAYTDMAKALRLRDRELLFDYLGIIDFERGYVINRKKIRLGDIADKHQLRDEQSVTNRYKKITSELRAELEKQGWIGEMNTQKQPAEKRFVSD